MFEVYGEHTDYEPYVYTFYNTRVCISEKQLPVQKLRTVLTHEHEVYNPSLSLQSIFLKVAFSFLLRMKESVLR